TIKIVFALGVNRRLTMAQKVGGLSGLRHFGIIIKWKRPNENHAGRFAVFGRSLPRISDSYSYFDGFRKIKFSESSNRGKDVGPQLANSYEGSYQERPEQRNSLPEANQNGSASPPYDPFIRRFALAVFSIFLGFGLGCWGVFHLDDERGFFGAAAIVLGALCPIGGWLLYYADLFPSTWGWWL